MAKRKKQKWGVGDIFLVPLADGTFSLGQVIGQEKEALNSAVCIFSATKVLSPEDNAIINLDLDSVVSALFVTPDLLHSGDWPVVANSVSVPVEEYFDMSALKAGGFVGTKIVGSGIVIKLMEACFGLYPWNGFFEPDYLDQLLLSPDKKPNGVIYK